MTPLLRFRVQVRAGGTLSTMYVDETTPAHAARRAIRSWRNDARAGESCGQPGYTRFIFHGPRRSDVATVNVYPT